MPLTLPHPSRLVLPAMAAVLAVAMAAVGPIAQPSGYHHFANTAALSGIPNFADVVSNLPFLAVALAGLAATRSHADAALRRAWQCFFFAVGLTAAGSAFYHWAPADFPLVWDRVPIALACGTLLCCFLGERVSRRWLSSRAIAAVALASVLSVAWWYAGQRNGAGDLRPYLAFQIAPMLLIPCGLAVYWREGVVQARWWLGALALYAIAKACELRDHELLSVMGWVSGHTLKHLVAALAAGCFVMGLRTAAGGREARG